jgi:glucosamine--fructose-6-phosphate aminotransferase (isomerizing)
MKMPVIVIAPSQGHYDKVRQHSRNKSRRKIIAVVTKGDVQVRELADHVIEIPASSDVLSPILTTIPLQLLSYHIAVLRGCNVDQPRNLAKSVIRIDYFEKNKKMWTIHIFFLRHLKYDIDLVVA